MTTTKEIMTNGNKFENTPSEMIRLAVTQGANLEQVEKLLALQERWEANEAKKAYNQAMSCFKANPPKIDKDQKVSYNGIKYNHASLYNITEKISVELSKYGLSASWTTKQNGQISVTCRITHKQGHSEETTLSANSDKSGSKNEIQAIGSTITYLQRYTLLALTGLATFDQDDDGTGATTEYIDDRQKNQILDLMADKEVVEEKFLSYMKIESLEKMPKSDYQKAIAALQAKKKATAK